MSSKFNFQKFAPKDKKNSHDDEPRELSDFQERIRKLYKEVAAEDVGLVAGIVQSGSNSPKKLAKKFSVPLSKIEEIQDKINELQALIRFEELFQGLVGRSVVLDGLKAQALSGCPRSAKVFLDMTEKPELSDLEEDVENLSEAEALARLHRGMK